MNNYLNNRSAYFSLVVAAILVGGITAPSLVSMANTDNNSNTNLTDNTSINSKIQSLPTTIGYSLMHPLLPEHNHGSGALTTGGHYQVIPQAYADSLLQTASQQGTLRHFTLYASSDTNFVLPTGEHVNLMSFNGTYPAPTLRVTQGDVVQITLINNDTEIHSIDFHGSQISAVPNFAAVNPGQSKTFTFVAVNPGAWVYHCEANNVFELWEHPLKGMAGMLIVDPKPGYTGFNTNVIDQTSNDTKYTNKAIAPAAREFTLNFGEYYLEDGTTPHSDTVATQEHDFSQAKMFNKIPTYTAINGVPYGYIGTLLTLPPWNTKHLSDVITTPNLDGADPALSALTTPDGNGHTAATHLNVKQGDHVRFYAINNGDNEVAFHIVGEQLDRVSVGSSVVAQNVETYSIAPYSDAVIDVVFENPGVYAIVNHDYSELFKGQAAIVIVGSTAGANPSNAVAPPSHLPGTSISQTTCSYGIGPNQQYQFNTGDDNLFSSQCAT